MSELLELVVLPNSARITIVFVALANFALAWLMEQYLAPGFAKLIAKVSDRLYLWNLDGYGDVPPARVAKIRKWTVSGKRFKIIQEEFR